MSKRGAPFRRYSATTPIAVQVARASGHSERHTSGLVVLRGSVTRPFAPGARHGCRGSSAVDLVPGVGARFDGSRRLHGVLFVEPALRCRARGSSSISLHLHLLSRLAADPLGRPVPVVQDSAPSDEETSDDDADGDVGGPPW